MSETTPVHTGTDRVELTDAEREALAEAVNRGSLGPAVESIVAARVQALTAEVAMLREALEICRETESDF